MAYGTPADPVGGTVITVSYAVSNLLDPIRWLRLLTGNADPPGSAYVVVSTSTTGTSWAKVTTDVIADDAVTGAKLAAGAVNEFAHLADGVITPTKFQTGAVDSAAIATNAVGAAELANGAVNEFADLADGVITTPKFATGCVDSAAIATNAVGAAELANGAVNEFEDLVDGVVKAVKTTAGVGTNGLVMVSNGSDWTWTAQSAITAGSANAVGGKTPTATPAANALPLADGSGLLDAWVTPSAFSIPSNLGFWVRQASHIPSGFSRDTSLDGLIPVGAGTTFTQTFSEGTSYGTSWAHTHPISGVSVTVSSVTVSGAAVGGPEDLTAASSDINGLATAGGVNLNTTGHTHSLNGVSFAVSASGTGSGTANGDTNSTTWLPPCRAVVWCRKN